MNLHFLSLGVAALLVASPCLWGGEVPSASFVIVGSDGSQNLGRIPLTVAFDASDSRSGFATGSDLFGVTDFHWDFGDGSQLWSKKARVDHTYLWPGSFNVTLTVTNRAGEIAQQSRSVVLLDRDPGFPGRILHVSVTGDDTSGDGSLARPWRRIAKAVAAVSAGDFVAVHPGTYDEYIDINRNVAQADRRITLVGYGAHAGGVKFRHSYYTVDGFAFNFSPTNVANAMAYVYQTADGIWIRNCHFHDSPEDTEGIFVAASSVPDQEPASGALNGIVHNNLFRNISPANAVIFILNGANWQVTDNHVYHTEHEGDFIKPMGEGHRIAGNYLYDIQSGGTGGHADFFQVDSAAGWKARNIVFERNMCVGVPGDIYQAQICQTVSRGQEYTNIVFRNNLFIHVRGQANVHGDQFKWYNNLFYRCAWQTGQTIVSGGENGSCYDLDIRNNIFFECGASPANKSQGWYQNGLDKWATNVTLTADYNFVCGVNGSPKAEAPPADPFRWAVNGQEASGINGGDPMFVDAQRFDFRLRPNSPLLGRGAALQGFNDDYYGQPRPATWSIGPLEAVPDSDPTVRIRPNGAQLEVIWQRGTLLESNAIDGDYSPVPGASAPSYTFSPQSGVRFFKIQL